MTLKPDPAPAGPSATVSLPLQIVLPRQSLDDCILEAWQHAPERSRDAEGGRIWHATLTLQPCQGAARPDSVQGLAGRMQAGPPKRLATRVQRPGAEQGVRQRGVKDLAPLVAEAFLLLYLAAPDELTPPAAAGSASAGVAANDDVAWERWLASRAPEYRLASAALRPDIVVLWLRADGTLDAVFRPGQQWERFATLQGGLRRATSACIWHRVGSLKLPGAEMLCLSWKVAARDGVEATSSAHSVDDPPDDEGRYSRLAPALGLNVLRRLQACTVAVVGAGRAGSVLASSLTRMGCSLLVLDPDTMSPHSLDGDLPAMMEGHPKVVALRRQLQGLTRPGTTLDLRMLPVSSPAAGALLIHADIIICAADNDAAALWADAWGLAMHKPRLVVASGLHPHGAEADLRLLLPGDGCLCCTGGFSQSTELPAQIAMGGALPVPLPGLRQRVGSLRSWGMVATHTALRMVEHMAAGRIRRSLFRRLVEGEDGGLEVRDWTPARTRQEACPMCSRLEGRGSAAVNAELLHALVLATIGAGEAGDGGGLAESGDRAPRKDQTGDTQRPTPWSA